MVAVIGVKHSNKRVFTIVQSIYLLLDTQQAVNHLPFSIIEALSMYSQSASRMCATFH